MGRNLKDYSELIGQKFGDREVLNVFRKKIGNLNYAFATCKCKCGSVDDVYLSRLRSGKSLQCSKCAKSNCNSSTGIPNISYDRSNNNYAVTIERKDQRITRHARTLDEAILIKDSLLKHFDKYGRFEIEKLNDSYYTRSPKRKNNYKSRKVKDYSYLIGKKLGDREIVSVDSSGEETWNKRTVQLRNNSGDTKSIKLKSALVLLKNQEARLTRLFNTDMVHSNTGIKNIIYRANMNRYVVQITRNNVKKQGSAKTLDEAIVLKEQFLREFENEAKAHD